MENKYKKDYLTNVTVRLEFSKILKLSGNNKEAAEEFRRYIFDKFPNVNFKVNNHIEIEYDSNEKKGFIDDEEITWIFTSNKNTKEVSLNANHLTLDYKKTNDFQFNNILEDINLLLDGLNYYYPFKFKSISLRYINQINGSDIKYYVNPSLTDMPKFNLESDEKLSQSITRADLTKGKYNLIFQYGFFNPQFPNPDFEKDFILDLNCNLQNMNLISSTEKIIKELKEINNFICDKFNYSITNQLKKEIGVSG